MTAGMRSIIKLPAWIDKKNPEEVEAFWEGVRAGRDGKPRPDSGRFYVVVYNGWIEGRRLRERKAKRVKPARDGGSK